MKRTILTRWLFAIALALGVSPSAAQNENDFGADLADEAYEALTSGPIHEAFATPVTLEIEESLVIEKAPPEPIEEIPPEVKPEDEGVIWIPGYWAWDEDREDFLWVSGVWRIPPPDQIWAPGYWAEVDGGWQWVPGFWTSAEEEEVAYLPTPPASLEQGPSSPSPGDDYFWSPGVWVWETNDYVWSPGYWAPVQQNWIWVAAHYRWTPMGCVFVPGYWDYTLPRRGVLFAPVYYAQPVYQTAGYYYSPSVVIDTVRLVQYLFVRPNYGHYFFGPYYGYRDRGYIPWFAFGRRFGYDPFYSYYNWRYARTDRDWIRRYDDFYRSRARADFRFPRSFREQYEFARRDGRNRDDFIVARRLDQVVNDRDSRWKFEQLDRDRRDRYRQTAGQFRDFQNERRRLEAQQQRERGQRDIARDGGRVDRDWRSQARLRVPDDLRQAARRQPQRDVPELVSPRRGRPGSQFGDRARPGRDPREGVAADQRGRQGDERHRAARVPADGQRDARDGLTRDARTGQPDAERGRGRPGFDDRRDLSDAAQQARERARGQTDEATRQRPRFGAEEGQRGRSPAGAADRSGRTRPGQGADADARERIRSQIDQVERARQAREAAGRDAAGRAPGADPRQPAGAGQTQDALRDLRRRAGRPDFQQPDAQRPGADRPDLNQRRSPFEGRQGAAQPADQGRRPSLNGPAFPGNQARSRSPAASGGRAPQDDARRGVTPGSPTDRLQRSLRDQNSAPGRSSFDPRGATQRPGATQNPGAQRSVENRFRLPTPDASQQRQPAARPAQPTQRQPSAIPPGATRGPGAFDPRSAAPGAGAENRFRAPQRSTPQATPPSGRPGGVPDAGRSRGTFTPGAGTPGANIDNRFRAPQQTPQATAPSGPRGPQVRQPGPTRGGPSIGGPGAGGPSRGPAAGGRGPRGGDRGRPDKDD